VLFAAGVSATVLEPQADRSCCRSPSPCRWPRRPAAADGRDLRPKAVELRAFDALPEGDGHVVIAGFGRVGQIVARILSAKRIPFTALDVNAEQVDFVRKFGAKIYYGDASRPEILEAAQTGKARAFVLAIDNVDVSIRTAQLVRQNYPHVPIFARSRHRQHTHRLMDAGVQVIRRETFLSSLDLTREVLRGLGLPERDVRFAVETFKEQDRAGCTRTTSTTPTSRRCRTAPRAYAQELEEMFEKDAAEQAKLAKESDDNGSPRSPAPTRSRRRCLESL
jgi:glutathione-regulated potassium-efflux system protein KefB